jgi:hypothetical protein
MKQTQIEIFQNIFLKTVVIKNETFILVSTIISLTVSMVDYLVKTTFLNTSLLILIIVGFMFLIDWFFGIMAAKKETDYKGIESIKTSYTIIKFIVFFMWIILSFIIEDKYKEVSWLSYIVSSIVTFPLILILLREFVSIGENIEKIYKKKPYIFYLVDKVFDIIENLFFSRLKSQQNE